MWDLCDGVGGIIANDRASRVLVCISLDSGVLAKMLAFVSRLVWFDDLPELDLLWFNETVRFSSSNIEGRIVSRTTTSG